MTTTNDIPKIIHQGRNVKRFREMLGLKQEALAYELGDDWTQKKISLLESKETIEPEVLQRIATILKVPEEAIKKFDEDAVFNVISNTFNDEAAFIHSVGTFNINPIDKWIEALEENKKLYHLLLKEKEEKIALLERLIEKK